MQAIGQLVVMFSILFPAKGWFAPDQPLNVQIRGAGGEVWLVLIDFVGKQIEGQEIPGTETAPPITANVREGQTVDIRLIWPQLRTAGTYILLAVPKGKTPIDFVGTPLVIGVRDDKRRDAPLGPMVVRVEPLRFGVISTDKGDMTATFFYDVAPDTVSNFISLASEGFYDGLSFHRVIKDFVIQTGDPRGDGTGGPGYHVEAEFSGREHQPGVLAMGRQTDPLESQGQMPRDPYANSGGSQFFICVDYVRTMQLNGRYTAFGKITEGMDAVKAIGSTPTDPKTDHPLTPQMVKSIRVIPVTPQNNPYASIFKPQTGSLDAPTTAPAEEEKDKVTR